MPRTLSALFMLLVVSAVIVPTVEARMNLNGSYASTTARSCTVSNIPFANDASGAPTVIAGGVFRQDAVDTAIVTFNADGTGMSIGLSRTMNTTTTFVGASIVTISEFSAPFTYVVNADDTVDVSFGVVTFTTVLGGGTGNTGTVSPAVRRLQMGHGAQALVSGPPLGVAQETLQIDLVGGGSVTQHRLCSRSATLVRK